MATLFQVCVVLDGVDDPPDDQITADSESANDALASCVASHLHAAAVRGQAVKQVTATCFASAPLAAKPDAATRGATAGTDSVLGVVDPPQ